MPMMAMMAAMTGPSQVPSASMTSPKPRPQDNHCAQPYRRNQRLVRLGTAAGRCPAAERRRDRAGWPLPFAVRSALSPAELSAIGEIRGYGTVQLDLPGNLDDTLVLAEVLAGSDFAIVPFVPGRAAAMSILGTFHPDTLITGVAPCRSAES